MIFCFFLSLSHCLFIYYWHYYRCPLFPPGSILHSTIALGKGWREHGWEIMFDFHFKINCACVYETEYVYLYLQVFWGGHVYFHWMTDSDFPASLGEFVLIWFSLLQKYDIIYGPCILKQLIPISNGILK